MKINISVDITPQELREAMGLPDFESFNKNLMEKMTVQFNEEKFDAQTFFKSMSPASNPIAKMFMDAAAKNMDMMNKRKKTKKEDKTI